MIHHRNAVRRAVVGTVGLALVLGLVVLPAAADDPKGKADAAGDAKDNPHLWKPRVTSVAVFKNGLGFFLREGEVKLRDGWCVARQVPPAAFGTFAIYSHNEKHLVDVVGSGPGEIVDFDGEDAGKDIATKRARLGASRSLKMQLTYTHRGNKRTASGKLLSVGPDYAVLESDANTFAVPVKGITRMQILELPIRVHVAGEAKQPAASTKLGMAYLRKGVTWIPEYTLKILDDETAELTLRGTFVNEAEDLVHCDVHFVVGVPHFLHTNYLAPIAVGQVIRTISAAVAPQAIRTQIMNRAALASHQGRGLARRVVDQPVRPAGRDVRSVLGSLPKMGGAAATDFTVYTRKDLTVRRGEKAIVTLFVKKIRYSHIYRWTPPGKIGHFFVLHNNTDTAWTTGPCLAISAKRPLSEDLLKYTPKNGRGELPVTAAINIAHEKTEAEIARKLKAYSPRTHYYYDLVTLEGTLELRNFEKRTVDVVITPPVPGKPIQADDGGKITVDTTKLKLIERSGTVRWKIRIEPGETRTLKYRYERYVPSS